MERKPEPELMDNKEQAQAYAKADFSTPNALFVEKWQQLFPHITHGSLIDLGCGPGDIIFRLLEKFPHLKITGVDGSQAMLDLAKEDPRYPPLANHITLKQCYLHELPALSQRYHGILSNSLLHHLPDPNVLWQTLPKIAHPQAAILIIDLFRPPSQEKAQEIVEQNAADEAPILKQDFYNSLLAAFTIEEIQTQLAHNQLNGLSVETISERHLMIYGKLCP